MTSIVGNSFCKRNINKHWKKSFQKTWSKTEENKQAFVLLFIETTDTAHKHTNCHRSTTFLLCSTFKFRRQMCSVQQWSWINIAHDSNVTCFPLQQNKNTVKSVRKKVKRRNRLFTLQSFRSVVHPKWFQTVEFQMKIFRPFENVVCGLFTWTLIW